MLESLKIILLCVAAAILYGVIHDQFTARVCVEYFTVFHPPIFQTQSPTLLALGWGFLATWWVGAFLGILLAFASRTGSRPRFTASVLIRPVGGLLLVMAVCATSAGFAGFLLTQRGITFPPGWVASILHANAYSGFMADWWAHIASYASGLLGGIALCIWVYRKRLRS